MGEILPEIAAVTADERGDTSTTRGPTLTGNVAVIESCAVRDPQCSRCELSKKCKTICLPGRGSDSPDVILIGEAPGETEDEQGKPFVGPAGQILREAVKVFQIPNVRITNIVRCRPPGNRTPTAREVKACLPYLGAEIASLSRKPRVLVALGNIALKALTGKTGITFWSGKVVGEYAGIPVFAIVHPSYILRDNTRLSQLESGFRELKWYLSPTNKPSLPEIVQVTSLLDVLDELEEPVAFDFETTGFSKVMGGKLRTVAFSDGKRCIWADTVGNPGVQYILKGWLMDKKKKIAHNLAFEMRWCIEQFGFVPKGLVWDTMLMDHLLDENNDHGLEQVAMRELSAPQWDIAQEIKDRGWDFSTVPTEILGPYNALDAYWTRKLWEALKPKMSTELKLLYNNILLPLAKCCARLEARGVKFDLDWSAKVNDLYTRRMGTVEKEIRTHPDVAVAFGGDKVEFNLNSSAQVSRLFYKVLGLPVIEKTDKGKPSVKEAVLERLALKYPLAKQYHEWKMMQTLRQNFLDKLPNCIDSKGYVHSSFHPAYVVTGRLAVSKPPLQAMPSDSLVRGVITSRFEGGKLAYIDYSQLEIRLIASESGEQSMIQTLKTGGDIHSETAKALFGENFTPDERKIAKTLNFSVVYGISAKSLSSKFNLTESKAQDILRKFKEAKSAIFKWMSAQHAKVLHQGFLTSRWGRVRRLKDISTLPEWEQKHALRQAGNFPIQSAGADITNTALILVDKFLRKGGYKSCVVHQVHDALLIDLHPDELHLVEECKNIMQVEVQERCPWLKVPLVVEAHVATRWGGAESIPAE